MTLFFSLKIQIFNQKSDNIFEMNNILLDSLQDKINNEADRHIIINGIVK
jgi:hypothetical protein